MLAVTSAPAALALVASLTDGRTLVRRTVPADGARDLAIALVAALHRHGITDVAVRLLDGAGVPLFVAAPAGGAL